VIYRKDIRSKGGGGVIILVKKYLASCQVELSYPANIISDVCCVDVQFVNKTYRLICIYRPQRKIEIERVDADLLCTMVSKLLSNTFNFFVAADLNLPDINWD